MEPKNFAIFTRQLVKTYADVTAVAGIDMTIPRGSITGLLGGNGAGKTTTITMLLGLLLPTSGEIHVLGQNMLYDRFAVLPLMNFSSPYVDLPSRLSIRQNLAVYGNLYGVQNLKQRINELADELQIGALLDRKHGTLSAGQKTRATLAKALLNKPQLLLLDEPTASLDPDTADWMRQLLMDYQKKHGATLFMASHNMLEVERMCDHVIMMRQGQIVNQGTPSSLIAAYDRTTMEEVFLDIARERR